jgi:peptidoglycan/xylan/chitin deacetylase (PgdA/CDA1 family)
MILRLIKLLGSVLVSIWDVLVRMALRLTGRVAPAQCVVLYYHAIPERQRLRFARQMDWLLSRAQPVAAGIQEPLPPGRRYTAVTFDDGFTSVVRNALPELVARQIPATLFVPTGSIGSHPLWIKNQGAPAKNETVVTAEELRILKTMDLLTIGSHSVNHPNLVELEPARTRVELADSKSELEKILGAEVDLFSFPHGAHNDRIIREAKSAGYRRVFTVSPQCAFSQAREFVTGRVLADPSDWRLEFGLKVLGAYRWLTVASNLKARLLPLRNRQTLCSE